MVRKRQDRFPRRLRRELQRHLRRFDAAQQPVFDAGYRPDSHIYARRVYVACESEPADPDHQQTARAGSIDGPFAELVGLRLELCDTVYTEFQRLTAA